MSIFTSLESKWNKLEKHPTTEVRGFSKPPLLTEIAIPSDCEDVRAFIKGRTVEIYTMYNGNTAIMTKTVTPNISKLGKLKGTSEHYEMCAGIDKAYQPREPQREGLDAEREKEARRNKIEQARQDKLAELEALGILGYKL
jgi:hypothetical protein